AHLGKNCGHARINTTASTTGASSKLPSTCERASFIVILVVRRLDVVIIRETQLDVWSFERPRQRLKRVRRANRRIRRAIQRLFARTKYLRGIPVWHAAIPHDF